MSPPHLDDPLRVAFNWRACADVFSGGSEGYPGARKLTALWVEEINERRAAWFDRHPEAVLAS